MEQYSVVLVCNGKEYKTFIDGDIRSDDELTFVVNGVKIHVEFDGNLYIEDVSTYSGEQLKSLAFLTQKNGEVVLSDYHFKCRVPVAVVNKQTHETTATYVEIEMKHDGTPGNAVRYVYSLLDARSQMTDIDYAISDLRSQLRDLYTIRICGCCKYGQANPYGGDGYLNYLCFRKNKIGYLQFSTGVDKKDWEFFSDKRNVEATRPTYCCEEFE